MNGRVKRGAIYLSALFILLAAVFVGFRRAGRWLVRDEALSRADVIMILSGSMPYRAEEAGRIFQKGLAGEVWISRPENPAGEMEKLGVRFIAEEDYNREILIKEGVSEGAIHILPETVINTEQELEEVGREMRQSRKVKVIIVTSPEHTRRVRALWDHLVGKRPQAMVHAAWEDPFDADHWWRNTRDAWAVVREVLGLMNAWARLPVRPHSD
jgi:uncharacterized SAM-binding protein YcdF (DUF218 family)